MTGTARGPRREKCAPRPGIRVTNSPEETFDLARELALGFKGNEVVLLEGELGAGKTIFAKGLAAGLGLADTSQVCSPSYTLLNIYQARVPVYHLDLYRLSGGSEVDELGWEDLLEGGVIIVEWAEKLPYAAAAVRVIIKNQGGTRRLITVIS